MGQNRKITFILTSISAIIGVMLVTQIQSNLDPKQIGTPRSITELRTALLKETEKRKNILADIEKQEQLLYEYEFSLNEGESVSVMKEELARVKKLAGFTSVEDKGIVIHIKDNPYPAQLPTDHVGDPGEYRNTIEDVYLRWLVNSLFSNGAKAVSINGHRLISSSSIRNVADDIQVDTKTIQPPFEVKALGDPNTLISALKLEEIDDIFLTVNKQVHIEQRDKLTIPAFTGQRSIRYMIPVKAKGVS